MNDYELNAMRGYAHGAFQLPEEASTGRMHFELECRRLSPMSYNAVRAFMGGGYVSPENASLAVPAIRHICREYP